MCVYWFAKFGLTLHPEKTCLIEFGRSAHWQVGDQSDRCQDHRHHELARQWTILAAKLRGHYQYYGRPTNFQSLWQFYRVVYRLWYKWLNRRTRGKTLKWKDYARILDHYPLPRPKITRAWMPAR